MTKKPPRRSIVSSFSVFSTPQTGEPDAKAGSGVTAVDAAPEQKSGLSIQRLSGNPVPRVGAGVIGATQRTLTDIREERDQLRAQVEAGGWLEIDPALVSPSPFPDRLPDDDPAAFEALKQTMIEDGQKVPVELRRHPSRPGHYQLVYGHRRWRAAQELGVKLKAFVSELSDRDMVMAQGIENAARQDLSWIEKALFAWQMEQSGIKARDIRAALVVDDPEVARFRAACRTLGVDMIRLIGRAPRAGRPRWGELVAAVAARPELLQKMEKTLAAAKDMPSDARFAACLMLKDRPAKPARVPLPLQGPKGPPFGEAVFGVDGVKLRVNKTEASAFMAFLEAELPALMARYGASRRGASDG
jgi:ParB family transcriptional regulator, chromosome partitioning protein